MSQQCFKQILYFYFYGSYILLLLFRKCRKYDSFAKCTGFICCICLVVVHFEGHTIVKAIYVRSW